jgi:rhamnose transport system ATP-binding protein
MSPPPPVLELRGVSKRFAAVWALRDVDLDLVAGEVHALVGENGAGKSTLVKILAGVHQPDGGTIRLRDHDLVLNGPAAARDLGIAVMHQQPNLFPDLDAAENVFAGRLPRTRLGRVDWREARAAAARLFARLGVPLKVTTPVRGLSVADQQLIEIAKALSVDAPVLVMDEPTAALSSREVERLFATVRQLRDHRVAVLFVNHRLEEVFELCDRITVLRDGRHVVTAPIAELTPAETIRHMVGRRVESLFPKEPVETGTVALQVTGLTRAGVFSDVSLAMCPSRFGAARSSRWRGWSALAGRRWPGRCSASTGRRPARCSFAAAAWRSRRPAMRCGRAWPTCRRTATTRA